MTRPDFTITADDARALAASARVCGRPDAAPGPRPGHRRRRRSCRSRAGPPGKPSARPAPARPGSSGSSSAPKAGTSPTNPTGPSRRRRRATTTRTRTTRTTRPAGKRVRSTRRRQNLPDLPRLQDVATAPSGRCSPLRTREAVPAVDVRHLHPALLRRRVWPTAHPKHPGAYDYRRAALDALHFSKLCGRFWTNLRRCAGFNVQYFSVIEAQRRLAPHLHAAIRGAIPRAVFRQVVAATDYALWWPPFDQAVYDSTGCPCGPDRSTATPTPTPARCCRPGPKRSTGSTPTRTRSRRT